MFDSTAPISYNDMANSTGHSPNTIKVYINSLKKKGVEFEEIMAPNGTKLYAVPNKQKVKKLYNF
jgi:biotin operon repressor